MLLSLGMEGINLFGVRRVSGIRRRRFLERRRATHRPLIPLCIRGQSQDPLDQFCRYGRLHVPVQQYIGGLAARHFFARRPGWLSAQYVHRHSILNRHSPLCPAIGQRRAAEREKLKLFSSFTIEESQSTSRQIADAAHDPVDGHARHTSKRLSLRSFNTK